MPAVTVFGPGDAVPEGSSARYRATLVDVDGNPITANMVNVFTVTLTDAVSNSVINDRNAQDCLTNGGTLAVTSGLFDFVLQPEDTIAFEGASPPSGAVDIARFQPRRLSFHVEFDNGVVNHAVEFYVRRLVDL